MATITRSPQTTGATPRRRKVIGLAFLAPPLALMLLFAVAEGIGQEAGWWGHVIQLAAVGGFAAAAWRWPRVGGPLLIVLGLGLAVPILLSSGEGTVNLPGLLLVFLPTTISGAFFTAAGYAGRRARSSVE